MSYVPMRDRDLTGCCRELIERVNALTDAAQQVTESAYAHHDQPDMLEPTVYRVRVDLIDQLRELVDSDTWERRRREIRQVMARRREQGIVG